MAKFFTVASSRSGNCYYLGSGNPGVLLDCEGPVDRSPTGKQAAAAERAFQDGRYFVLLNDRQAENLDETIDLARTTEVTFLLLTPLKGG